MIANHIVLSMDVNFNLEANYSKRLQKWLIRINGNYMSTNKLFINFFNSLFQLQYLKLGTNNIKCFAPPTKPEDLSFISKSGLVNAFQRRLIENRGLNQNRARE